MGIINTTPDSFSGDGLMMAPGELSSAAVDLAVRMATAGADILDVGGESTRPDHQPVHSDLEKARVVGVVAAIRMALPGMPISIDTTKADVAAGALDAGADIINDVAAVASGAALAQLAAERGVPYILMHSRAVAEYQDVVGEVVADLTAAMRNAERAGCSRDTLVVDPGIGFGKTASHNLTLLRELSALRILGAPILLGASRKSTIGRVLGLPAGERLEGTLATTALGIAQGVDIVRVHDVEANVRAARMADAIVRGQWQDGAGDRPDSSQPS